MSKRSRTHWYVSGEDSIAEEQKTDQTDLILAGSDRRDSCQTDRSISLEDVDEVDRWYGDFLPMFKLSEEQLQQKVIKYDLLIGEQLQKKEENVSKYLEVTQGNLDKHQLNKLKLNFEKINLRCSQNIDYFRRKKDNYLKISSSKFQHSNQGSSPPRISLTSASAENVVAHKVNRMVDTRERKSSKGYLNTDELQKLPYLLMTRSMSRSAADLSPRMECNTFFTKVNNRSTNLSDLKPPKIRKESSQSFKEFLLAKQKLKELNGTNDVLTDSISDLQLKLKHINQDGKELFEWQKKRTLLQRNMCELLGKQQEEINAIKKELHVIEEKIELKVNEKGRELQEAIESCQYQAFQLEHTSSNRQKNIFPTDGLSIKSIGLYTIKSLDHLLTLIAAICVIMATAASFLRYYQLNATWLQRTIILAVIVGAFFILWNLTSDGRNFDNEL